MFSQNYVESSNWAGGGEINAIASLDLSEEEFTNIDLETLRLMSNVTNICLKSTRFGQTTLDNLKALINLKGLNLSYNKMLAFNFNCLDSITYLSYLNLSRP
jgi:hypothetical protein